jgi:hypothetical protein
MEVRPHSGRTHRLKLRWQRVGQARHQQEANLVSCLAYSLTIKMVAVR